MTRRKSPTVESPRSDRWLIFWVAIAVAFGAISFLMAMQYTWVSDVTVVPVVGESIFQRKGHPSLAGPPSVQYATTEASSFLATMFQTTRDADEIDVLIADLVLSKPCAIIGGAIINAPMLQGRFTIPTRLGESHDVAIYRLRILPERSHFLSITCDVSTAPGADSYATRNIQYIPMPALGPGIPPGFVAAWPQHVSFSAAGTIDLAVTGDIAQGPISNMFEEREIGPKAFTTRARWTSVQAQAHRDFGLFVAAALSGIAATSIIEALRRLFASAILKESAPQ